MDPEPPHPECAREARPFRPLPPNSGLPEFGTLKWPKSDISDLGWGEVKSGCVNLVGTRSRITRNDLGSEFSPASAGLCIWSNSGKENLRIRIRSASPSGSPPRVGPRILMVEHQQISMSI